MKSAPRLGAWFLTILLCAGLLGMAPRTVDAATVWHTENVGLSDTIGQFRMAPADNERIGMTYRFASGGAHKAWGFAIRSAGDSGTWSIKSADITVGYSITAVYCVPQWITGTIWIAGCQIAESTNCCNRIFRSTDDGVTWSNQAGLVINTNFGAPLPDTFTMVGTKVAMLAFGNSISDTNEIFQTSSDNGVSWTTAVSLSDNAGSPSGTATVNTVGGGGGRIQYDAASNTITAAWEPGTKTVGVQSQDGGSFWTVPYTSTANCNADAFCGSPGSNGFCEACANVDGGSVVLVKSRFPTSGSVTGDIGYAAGGLYAWKDTTTGALLDVQAGATSTESPASACTTKGTVGSGRVAFEGVGSTWMAAQQCTTPNALNIYEKVGIGTAWSVSTSIAGITTNDVAVGMTATKTYVAYTDSSVGGQVKVTWANTPSVSTALTATASATVTGLVGFDADPFNQVVVARTDTGTKIRSFDASSATLAQRQGSPITSACNQVDGVLAYSTSANGKQYAGFVNCDGSNVVNDFSIRGGDLLTPDQTGTDCTDGLGLSCDVDLNGHLSFACQGYALPDGALDMGSIAAIPISWESGGGGVTPHAQVGFAYSNTANGNIGTWTIRQTGTGTGTSSQSCRQEVAFSSPGNTYQICSWRNTVDNQDYIAAAGPSNPTKAWQFALDSYSFASDLHTTLTPVAASVSAPYDHLRAISCVDNDALVIQATSGQASRIHLVGGGIGGVVWGPISGPTGTVVQRGAAVSRDSKWAAIASDTNVEVLNFTTGAVLATFPTPSGTFKEMRMSSSGQVLWIATSTSVNKYDIHGVTTITSVAEGSSGTGSSQVCRNGSNVIIPCTGPSSTVAPATTTFGGVGGTCGFPGLDVASAASASGMTTQGFCGLLGAMVFILFTGSMALLGATAGAGVKGRIDTGKLVMVLGTAGAVTGFILDLYFGLFSVWLLVFLFMVAGAVVIFFRPGGSSA